MTRRKEMNDPIPIRRSGKKLVFMGDVRQAPIELCEGGRTFHPVVALWVRAEDGLIVGQFVDEPGHPAQTLVKALRAPVPVPGQPQTSDLPNQVILFNEELARQVRPLLAPLNIDIVVLPPFEPFEDLFANLFAHLQQIGIRLALPDDVLRPLISAVDRLWRAKPWEYTFDYPPFAIVQVKEKAQPIYASVLGANEELYGVALYTSLEDYKATMELSESVMGQSAEDMSPVALDEAATEVLGAIRHRTFLVSFEPKGIAPPAYSDELARGGWSRRLNVVPIFAAMGEGQEPGLLDAEEAANVTLAVESLVAFCKRHSEQIANDEFPIRDTVEVSLAGETVTVDVSVQLGDLSATA